MSGFRNEKDVWAAQKPSLRGLWDRYELMTPAGHPDIKGSDRFQIHYIENKVGKPDYGALEESQRTYIEWLLSCGQNVWLCFGGTEEKSLIFIQLPPDQPRFWEYRMPRPSVPYFWSGPIHQSREGWRYCGKPFKKPG